MAGVLNVVKVAAGVLLRSVLPAAMIVVVGSGSVAFAQSGGSGISGLLKQLSPGDIQNILQQMGGQSGNATQLTSKLMPQQTVLSPTPTALPTPEEIYQPQSRLEKIMSDRAGKPLRQFGYDQLASGQLVQENQIGALQGSYILGTGDSLDVTLRGQENAEYTVSIDREGRIVLPKMAPIPAAGRSLGEFKRALTMAVRSAYISTKAYVSVMQVRQLSVMVVGNVRNPGVQTLSGLSNVLDALNLAGGIRKSGTLRNIVIVRGDHVVHVDLYAFLTSRDITSDLALAQGDRIIVPAIGATVAISGGVRRPGIYELPPGSDAMSERGLLALGEGVEIPGVYRKMILKTLRNGKQDLVDISEKRSPSVHDGEILFVNRAVKHGTGKITLAGAVELPGTYALNQARTLHDLLPSLQVFKQTPYLLLGVIIRIDPQTLQREVIPFSPLRVVRGEENRSLISDDQVRIFSNDQMKALAAQIETQAGSASTTAMSPESSIMPLAVGGSLSGANVSPGSFMDRIQQQSTSSAGVPNGTASALALSASGTRIMSAGNAADTSSATSTGRTGVGGTAAGDTTTYTTSGSASAASGWPGASGARTYVGNANSPAVASAGSAGADAATASNLSGTNGSSLATLPGYLLPGYQQQMSSEDRTIIYSTIPGLTDIPEADVDEFLRSLVGYRIALSGAVRYPGVYLMAPGTTLDQVLSAAGGLATDANTSVFEITSTRIEGRQGVSKTVRRSVTIPPDDYSNIVLHRLDSVRFHHVYTDRVAGVVSIAGQVRYPGTYRFLRGESLSQVLARAGGLTDIAYPYGTVFLRKSLAAGERQAHLRIAHELQLQLTQSLGQSAALHAGGGTSLVTGMSTFIQGIKDEPVLGRMTVIADPTALAANPKDDPVMQAGDTIYIPQRPSTILVTGAVMQPGNYVFSPDASVDDYINQAGGYDENARDGMTYVVYPDGTARRVDESWLHFNSAAIPPGSTIYVPRNLFPTDWRILTTTISGIFKDFAISAASLAAVTRNN